MAARKSSRNASRRVSERALLTLVLIVAVSCFSGPSAAQTAPSPEDKETARNLVAVGNDKLQAGDYAAALLAFRGADAIMGVPTTGLGVGRSLLLLGRMVEARDELLRVTRIPAAADEPVPFAHARTEAGVLAEAVADRIPSITVTLNGPKPDTPVTMTIDGRSVSPETMGLPRRVDPGEHAIVVTAPNFEEARQTITLVERQKAAVEFNLVPAAKEHLPAPPPPSDSSPGEAVTWIGFSVAGAGLILGAIAGGAALSAASAAEEGCDADANCPSTNADDAERATTLAHVSTGGFALAGVGAVVGLIGLLQSPSEKAALIPVAVPVAASAEVGLSLIGRF